MSLATSVIVRSSPILKLYLLLIPVLAYVALLYAGLVLYGELGFYSHLMLLVGLLLIVRLVRIQFLSLNSYRLEVDREGRMVLCDIRSDVREEIVHVLDVNSSIVVWSQLILLHIHDEFGVKRCLLIFRDALSEGAFRQLRVVLTSFAQRRLHSLLDNNHMTGGNF